MCHIWETARVRLPSELLWECEKWDKTQWRAVGFWCSVELALFQLRRANGDWRVLIEESSHGLSSWIQALRHSRTLPPAWRCYRSSEGKKTHLQLFYPFLFKWDRASLQQLVFEGHFKVKRAGWTLPLSHYTKSLESQGERGPAAHDGADLVGKTPRRPAHSTVCSGPRAGKGCKCQHTWVQSEREEEKQQWEKKLLSSSASATNLQASPATLGWVKITF